MAATLTCDLGMMCSSMKSTVTSGMEPKSVRIAFFCSSKVPLMNTFVDDILCLRGVSLCTDEAREEVDVRDGAGVDNVLEPAMTNDE